jgi:hypothetical protein
MNHTLFINMLFSFCAFISALALNVNVKLVRQLSVSDATTLRQIIMESNAPESLSVVLGGCGLMFETRLEDIFYNMILLKRLDSFLYLYSSTNFGSFFVLEEDCRLMVYCAFVESWEIFDYLAIQKFNVEGFYYEMVEMMRACDEVEKGLAAIEVVRRVATLNEDYEETRYSFRNSDIKEPAED